MSETLHALPPEWTELFDSAELFAAVLGCDGRLLYANKALRESSGWHEGQLIQDLLHQAHDTPAARSACPLDAWMNGSRPLAPIDCRLLDRSGVQRSVRWHPRLLRGADGQAQSLALLGTDLTERRASEARMRRSTDFCRVLTDMRMAAIGIDDPQRLYEAACRILVESGRAVMAWVGLIAGTQLVPVAWSGPARAYTEGMQIRFDNPAPGERQGPSAYAATTGRIAVCNNIQNDPRTDGWRERAEAFGVKASAAFPIQRAGRVVGTVNLYYADVGAFDEALVELVELLVRDLSFALEHIDREAARAQAVREAQAGYERFRRVFDSLPVAAMIFKRPEGTIVDVNEVSARLYGYARDELIGRKPSELGLGLDPAQRDALWAALDREGKVHDWEAQVRRRGGELRDVLMNVQNIDFLGSPCLLNISIDITERRRMEQALSEREQQLSGIIDTAMEAIVAIDAQHKIVVFNPAAARMFGVPPEEAIGQGIERFIPMPYREAHRGHVERFAARGHSSRTMGVARELLGLRANGDVFPMEASISRTGEGEQQRMTVMIRDVTELRQAERAQLARTAAEAANQAKTEFLSRISHELRTPLNAILGFAQLMRSDSDDALSTRHLGQLDLMLQAGSHLRTLIEEVLDVSRIEAGRMALEERDFDLRELLDSVLPMCQPQATQAQVSLHAAYEDAGGVRLHTDPARLRQVMLNLLSNAIKYNRPGGWVRVEVQRERGEVQVVVRDNGLGMSEQQKSRLFQPFNRLGREYSEVQGTGIGLVLVRQLVGLMHGGITVESWLDEGTTVRVSLPICASDGQAALSPAHDSAPQGDSAPRGTVLYIEDNPVNAMLVQEMLSRWPGVQAVIAPDGASGLARARSLQPDVVLLDMQLPDMDGMAVLRELKAHPSTRSLPVVMLSASAADQDMRIARAAGALHYWTKPIDYAAFLKGMRELLPQGVPA